MIDKCLECSYYDNTNTFTDTGYCDLWKSYTHEGDGCENFEHYKDLRE